MRREIAGQRKSAVRVLSSAEGFVFTNLPLQCQQPEPVGTCGGGVATRPSSALFGYPSLPSMQHGTLPIPPPVPLPRLSLQANGTLGMGGMGTLSAYGTVQHPHAHAPHAPSLGAYSTLAHTLKTQRERERARAREREREPATSSSEEEDRTDLLGRNFQVPRPKSRSSLAVSGREDVMLGGSACEVGRLFDLQHTGVETVAYLAPAGVE